jgi:hypothetical protein
MPRVLPVLATAAAEEDCAAADEALLAADEAWLAAALVTDPATEEAEAAAPLAVGAGVPEALVEQTAALGTDTPTTWQIWEANLMVARRGARLANRIYNLKVQIHAILW